jgi:transposase
VVDLTITKSTHGKAINYTIPLWQRMLVFLNNPLVLIDDNLVERAIKVFAVSRKNYLFFDESTGSEASTAFYTLISTAAAKNVEPMHYLLFLFNRLEHFGFERMPWEDLLPLPSIRDYAKSIGIDYSMGY